MSAFINANGGVHRPSSGSRTSSADGGNNRFQASLPVPYYSDDEEGEAQESWAVNQPNGGRAATPRRKKKNWGWSRRSSAPVAARGLPMQGSTHSEGTGSGNGGGGGGYAGSNVGSNDDGDEEDNRSGMHLRSFRSHRTDSERWNSAGNTVEGDGADDDRSAFSSTSIGMLARYLGRLKKSRGKSGGKKKKNDTRNGRTFKNDDDDDDDENGDDYDNDSDHDSAWSGGSGVPRCMPQYIDIVLGGMEDEGEGGEEGTVDVDDNAQDPDFDGTEDLEDEAAGGALGEEEEDASTAQLSARSAFHCAECGMLFDTYDEAAEHTTREHATAVAYLRDSFRVQQSRSQRGLEVSPPRWASDTCVEMTTTSRTYSCAACGAVGFATYEEAADHARTCDASASASSRRRRAKEFPRSSYIVCEAQSASTSSSHGGVKTSPSYNHEKAQESKEEKEGTETEEVAKTVDSTPPPPHPRPRRRKSCLASSNNEAGDGGGPRRSAQQRGSGGSVTSFSVVEVRQYSRILGDHPASDGPPLSIGWDHIPDLTVRLSVDDHEKGRHDRWIQMERSSRGGGRGGGSGGGGGNRASSKHGPVAGDLGRFLILPRDVRESMLLELGYTPRDLAEAVRAGVRTRNRRRRTAHNSLGAGKAADEMREKASRVVMKLGTVSVGGRRSSQEEAEMRRLTAEAKKSFATKRGGSLSGSARQPRQQPQSRPSVAASI